MSQAMNMMTDMAMQSVRSNNLDTERNRLNNISNSKDNALKEKELRKAAEGFEAIFIQKMWDEMRSSLPKNGMHYSKEEEYWQSMYSQELGKSMASAGGIGLADMMVEQLTKPAVASPQTGALSRIRMAVEPAPLVPETPKTAQQAEQKAEQTAQNPSRPLSRGNRDLVPNFYEEFNPAEQTAAVTANAMALQNQTAHSKERQNQAQQTNNQQEQQRRQEQLAQPQIVRTTYVTNLPPEKRSHAILDRKGNPVKKAENTRTNEISVPTRNDYFDRSLSINRTIKAEHAQNSDLTVNNQNMQAMQAEQKPDLPTQSAQAEPRTAEPQDILAGIATTYIPYHQRMAQQIAMQRTAEASQIPQVQDIRQTQHAQSQKTFKLPSLEEALNMGTLVASISDEDLAGARQRQETQNSVSAQAGQAANKAKTAAAHDNAYNTAPAGARIQNTAQHAVSHGISPDSKSSVSALAPQTDFAMPAAGTITSHFGWRFNPETRQREWHKGIDIETKQDSAVTAGKAGTVTFAGYDKDLGSTVIIDHGSGIESVYAHAGKLSVKVGDVISSGTQIAKTGTDKDTQKARLHFEIRQNGLSINPEPYFSKEEIS